MSDIEEATDMSKLDARSFVRRGKGLFPVDADADELVMMLPEEKELRVTVRQPRNPRHSARFHVMMRKVMDNVEAWSHRSYDEFLDALKIEAGHTETRVNIVGEIYKRPKSIDFGNMDEIEFKRFERRAVYVVQKVFGIDAESLMAEVDDETRPTTIEHQSGTDSAGDAAGHQPATSASEGQPATVEPTAVSPQAQSADRAAGEAVAPDTAAGKDPKAIPPKEPKPAAGLSTKEKALLRKYAAGLADANLPRPLSRGSSAFLSDYGITEGTPAYTAATAIYQAHLARVNGTGSPAEADAVVDRVLA